MDFKPFVYQIPDVVNRERKTESRRLGQASNIVSSFAFICLFQTKILSQAALITDGNFLLKFS